ncbi:hypothetical protein V8E51_006631 [Hyaloscypha variabilis]
MAIVKTWQSFLLFPISCILAPVSYINFQGPPMSCVCRRSPTVRSTVSQWVQTKATFFMVLFPTSLRNVAKLLLNDPYTFVSSMDWR